MLLLIIPPHTESRCRVGGDKILVGKVVRAKLSGFEEKVREGFLRKLRKEFTGVVQGL